MFKEELEGVFMNHYDHEIINDDTRLQLHFGLISSTNDYSPIHWHGHLEIIFISKGYMTAYVGEQKYTLRKDDLLIVNPRELHSTRTWSDTNYLLLQIPYSYLSRVLNQVPLIQFQEFFPSLTMYSTQRQLLDCLFGLIDTYQAKEDGYLLHFSSIIYEFLYILYRNHSHRLSEEAKEKENRNLERIEEVIQYVKTNYRDAISLNDVAKLLNVSPEYFCRIFKKHTGQTFLEYLGTVRMHRFYQELISSDLSITQLLENNGITNYKAFCRDFKNAYGAPPRQIRKRDSV